VYVHDSAGRTWRGQLTVVGALDHLEDGLTAAIHPPRVAVVRDPVPGQAHVQSYMTQMPKVAVVKRCASSKSDSIQEYSKIIMSAQYVTKA